MHVGDLWVTVSTNWVAGEGVGPVRKGGLSASTPELRSSRFHRAFHAPRRCRPRIPTHSPRQGDEVAINLHKTLSGGHYRWIAASFNSSLAHHAETRFDQGLRTPVERVFHVVQPTCNIGSRGRGRWRTCQTAPRHSWTPSQLLHAYLAPAGRRRARGSEAASLSACGRLSGSSPPVVVEWDCSPTCTQCP